eukprot:GFUD01136137.1.p1 GENE.GFUD01136137.1~~GFUD01136137.1.p1  ORF type:complete len:308 (+),score=51.64 GFUD01136137.1:21-944(+)
MDRFLDKGQHDILMNDVKTDYSKSDGIKLIGAGLPRTGTLSLKTALTQLYSGRCYHMLDVFTGDQEDVYVWVKAVRGEMKPQDWKEYFGKKNYATGVDFPFSLFYKDIMAAYPDAKVVLSTRDPKTWHGSVFNSIYQIKVLVKRHPTVPLLLGLFDRRNPSVLNMQEVMGNTVPHGCEVSFTEAIEGGPKVAEKFFNDWEAEVRRTVPSENLLVASAKEGWAPLCNFLGLPVPENDYPRVNDTASIQKMIRNIWLINGFVFYVVPASIAVGTYLFRAELAPVVQTVVKTVLGCKDMAMERLFKFNTV